MYPTQTSQPQQTYSPSQQPPPPPQQPQVVQKPSPIPGILLILLKLIGVGAVAVVGGTFLETIGQEYLVFEPQALLTIWVVSFLIALTLKINYTSILYIIVMIAGTLLVAYYPFSQAFLITFLLLLLGKLVRLL